MPLVARAQSTRPVIGFFRTTPAAPFVHLLAAFRQGLADAGFVDGQNVTIEQRWANNQLDRLPALARDLVERRVSAIVGNGEAMRAAKVATSSIPIVFVIGDDPIKSGLVDSFSRPSGNVTGVTFFGGSQLNAKRLDLLRELTPKANLVAVLVDGSYAAFVRELPDVE